MAVVLFTGSDQQMCCGQTFSVGDRVTWQVSSDASRAHIARVLGDELAETVSHIDATHDQTSRGAPLTGVVEGIDAVYYEERPIADHPEGYTHEPVPINHRDAASRREPQRTSQQRVH